MNITIVGTGYVGLVTGACFASTHNVTCVDTDERKIASLKRGEVPLYEPGLEALLYRNRERLTFTTSLAEAMEAAEIVFIAVGTPADADGNADLSAVLAVAEAIGQALRRPTIIVDKSTVPVGTAVQVAEAVGRNAKYPFSVVSNPEFLKEGRAIEDFTRPDRVVIGADSGTTFDKIAAVECMRTLYRTFVRDESQIHIMSTASAELTKYAANAMLATRISFMNELAALCEKVGADVDEVRRGVGSDRRIGPEFLYAGGGWGGSCFGKDIRALMATAAQHDTPLAVVAAAYSANARQKHVLGAKIKRRFHGKLEGRRIVIWGLAFKPGTDDTREAVAYTLIAELQEAGAIVTAYDPIVRQVPEHVDLATDPYAPLEGADAVVLTTEWPELRSPDWRRMYALMTQRLTAPSSVPTAFDGRNAWSSHAARSAGFLYYGIGRRESIAKTGQ